MSARMVLHIALFLLGIGSARAQAPADTTLDGEEEVVEFIPSQYRILAVRPLPGTSGIQAGFSRAYYLVNFGARQGVKLGSVFEVYSKRSYLGLVHVAKTWRDTAYVRPLRLEFKANRDALFPLQPGYQLKPKYVNLETVLFDSGKPQFSVEMNERLHFASRFINSFPNHPLILEGHTDNKGNPEKNILLSQQRAEQIKIFLNEIHFIPLLQMHTIGLGDTDPVASNATAEGRLQNRRVDIILMDVIPE